MPEIENTVIEYKSLKKVTSGDSGFRDMAVTCVSLANVQGGKIIVGFDDKTKLPPPLQVITDDIVNDSINRLRSLCFNVGLIAGEKETHENGGQFFSILVQPSLRSIATTSDGKIYIRIGDHCQPARSEDIIRIASEKDSFQWELQTRNVPLNQLPQRSIEWFAAEIRASDRVNSHIREMSDIEIMERYNLISNNLATNLGVLWLGNAAQRSRLTYPINVQYIVYDDNENKIRKEDWQDYSLNPKQLILDVEKKAVELTYFDEFPQGLFRNKIRHYDERLIRELLINAIAHKSYNISGDIFIKVYNDRLEITNPGGLPLGVSKDNILHTTNRRNPHLIRTLHDLKLMEGEGTGYNLIYEISSRDSKAFPELLSEYDSTTVIQYSKILDPEVIQLIDFVARNYQLSQKEYIVLGIIGRQKKMLSTALSKELQLSEEERLRTYVGNLLKQSIIISRGNKKGTEYLINPKLIASSKINIKPTLVTIEKPRLKALIEEILKITPELSVNEIHKKIGDVPLADIRKAIYKMAAGGILDHSKDKTYRKYWLAKKNRNEIEI